MSLNAEVSFDTFCKELGLFGFVLAVLLPNLSVGYLRGPFGSRKFVILRHDVFGSDSKLMEL